QIRSAFLERLEFFRVFPPSVGKRRALNDQIVALRCQPCQHVADFAASHPKPGGHAPATLSPLDGVIPPDLGERGQQLFTALPSAGQLYLPSLNKSGNLPKPFAPRLVDGIAEPAYFLMERGDGRLQLEALGLGLLVLVAQP